MATDCQIQYNDVYNAGRLTKDLGVFYQQNVDGDHTRIHHNKFHDNLDVGGYSGGFYLDNYNSNFVVDHNVIWGCDAAMKFNTPCNNALIYNNTAIGTTKSFDHWGNNYADDMYGVRVFNNIFNKGYKYCNRSL